MPSTVSVFQSLDTVEVKAGAILDAKVIRNLPMKGSKRRVMLESSACNYTMRLDVPEETKLLEAKNQLRDGGALKVRVKSVDFNASLVVAEIDEVVLKQWQDERKPPSAYENGTVVEAKVLSIPRAKKGVTLVDIGCKEPARVEAPNSLLKVLRWNDTFTDVRVRVDSESGNLRAVLPNEAIAMLEARYKVIKEQNEKEQAQREKEKQKQEEEREKRRMEQKKKKEKKRKERRERQAAALPNITRAPKQDDVDFVLSFPDAPDGKMYKMALQGLRLDTVDMSKGTITVKVDQAEEAKEAKEANEEETQARTSGKKKWGKEVKKPLTEIYKGISEGDVITGRVEVKNRAGIWIALEGYDTTRHLRLKVPPNLIPKFDWKEELSNLTVASLTEEKSELVMPKAAMKETEERKREQMDPKSIKEGHVFAEGYVVNLINRKALLDVGLTNYVTLLGVWPLGTKLTNLKVTKVKPGPKNPFILVKAGKQM